MAGTYLKATQIARMTVGLLYRDLVVARTVWTDAIAPGEFTGALNDTVTMRVPARRTARKRTLRAGTAIVNDTSKEFGVPVQLTTDVYNGAPITDEELTLDITDFGTQILQPQTRAVAEGLEAEIVDEIENATYATTIDADDAEFDDDLGNTDWYKVAVRARRELNEQNVPPTERYWLVGSAIEEKLLTSDRLVTVQQLGPEAAATFHNASIGMIAGFVVIPTTEIDEDASYAYHRSAFVLATRAPIVPRGVAFGTTQQLGGNGGLGDTGFVGGVSARWIMDYDYTNTTDRSLVNAWAGTATVVDPIDITGADSGGNKHLIRAVAITTGS
jgi:hypothetical protein